MRVLLALLLACAPSYMTPEHRDSSAVAPSSSDACALEGRLGSDDVRAEGPGPTDPEGPATPPSHYPPPACRPPGCRTLAEP